MGREADGDGVGLGEARAGFGQAEIDGARCRPFSSPESASARVVSRGMRRMLRMETGRTCWSRRNQKEEWGEELTRMGRGW
jgi:hypothetical protein